VLKNKQALFPSGSHVAGREGERKRERGREPERMISFPRFSTVQACRPHFLMDPVRGGLRGPEGRAAVPGVTGLAQTLAPSLSWETPSCLLPSNRTFVL
jgi:hypothetical protein